MPIWTPAQKEFVKTMTEAGASANELIEKLYDEFGLKVSRNAVIGIRYRNGWASTGPKNKGGHPRGVPLPRPKTKPKPMIFRPQNPLPPLSLEATMRAEEFDEAIPHDQRKTLLQLNDSNCHWPVGDPRDVNFFFCGAPIEIGIGLPYCDHHTRRACGK